MLKYNQPNPLNVFGLRQLEHEPPHFTRITFNLRVNQKNISDWVWANLEGRFWIGDYYYVNSETNMLEFTKAVSFERAGEASMFALILDQINSQANYM